jgi:hypothetical protein
MLEIGLSSDRFSSNDGKMVGYNSDAAAGDGGSGIDAGGGDGKAQTIDAGDGDGRTKMDLVVGVEEEEEEEGG